MIVMGAICFSEATFAQKAVSSEFNMLVEGGYRYMSSNGVPKVTIAAIKPQTYVFRTVMEPKPASAVTPNNPAYFFGIALNGVPFDANRDTAPDTRGGFFVKLGQYAYNAIPPALVTKDLSHVGYAADGFAVFVSTAKIFKSSYNEKKEFVAGSGSLDRCNGATVNQKYYIYVITEEYPQLPLCWTGTPDDSFLKDQSTAGAKPVKMPPPANKGFNPMPNMNANVEKNQAAFIARNQKARSHEAYR
jgi:hypothetical protein